MLTSKHIVINGGLAQSEECVVCNDEAPRSKLGFSIWWSYSVMVITLDFESSNPGSNPGRTFFGFFFGNKDKKTFAVKIE